MGTSVVDSTAPELYEVLNNILSSISSSVYAKEDEVYQL
jgi:hypothetical protein